MNKPKFRAWDKEHKVMCQVGVLGLGQKLHREFDVYLMCAQREDGWHQKHENIILIQYTGLKDKNGKDIYEGDILRFPAIDSWEKENYSAFEVFYHDNDCADNHVGFQMNRMHNYGAIAGGFCGHQFLPKVTAKFEIIGNIYENPELLSSK